MSRIFSLLLLGLVGAASFGQSVPSGRHLTVFEKGAYLLSARNVRDELKLDATVVEKIDSEFEMLSQRQKALTTTQIVDEAAFNRAEKVAADHLLQLLTAEQAKRLSELTFQRLGIRSLSDLTAAKKLDITPAHSKEIESIFAKIDEKSEEIDVALADLLAGLKVPEDKAKQKAVEETRNKIIKSFELDRINLEKDRKEANLKAFDVLSIAEQGIWKGVQGKPFKFED